MKKIIDCSLTFRELMSRVNEAKDSDGIVRDLLVKGCNITDIFLDPFIVDGVYYKVEKKFLFFKKYVPVALIGGIEVEGCVFRENIFDSKKIEKQP